MGAVSYSSYSGKGSSYSSSSARRSRESVTPMRQMLSLLEDVEDCRADVKERELELDRAMKELKNAEAKVTAQIDKLDPQMRNRLIRMLGDSRKDIER